MMTHDDIQADLPLYVLGSLDPDEHGEVARHLAAGCGECERELTSWREVVDLIPLGIEKSQSPDLPDLKGRLLAELHTPKRPAGERRGRVIAFPRWVAIPLAAAAVALFAFAMVRDVRLRTEVSRQQQVVADIRADLAAANGQLDQVRRVLSEKERDVASLRSALAEAQESLSVLQTRGLNLVKLQQTPDAQPAEGHVIFGRDVNRALFYAFDLPQVPANKTYELWWITEKEGPVNAGLFVPGKDGLGRIETAVPRDAGTIKAAAVTIEPAGGVTKPTGPMVLLGNVRQGT